MSPLISILVFDAALFFVIYYDLLKQLSTLPLWKLIFKKNGAKDFFILLALVFVVYVFLEKLLLVCSILIEEREFYELVPFIGYFRIAYVFMGVALMEKICRKIKPIVKGRFSGHVKLEYAILGLLLVFIKVFATVRMIYALIERLNVSFITFRDIEIVESLDMGYGYFYLLYFLCLLLSS